MKKKYPQTISVIIPTKNRPEMLGLVLSALHKQTPQVDEIIIVDTSNTVFRKKTNAIVDSFPSLNIRYWALPHSSASGARNYGIKRSSGEILAFLDDDSVPEQGWAMAINRAVEVGPFWFRGLCVDASKSNTITHKVYTFYKTLATHDHNRQWATYGRINGYQVAGLIQAGNFFVSRDTLSHLQPVFDERLFPFFAEGADLSYRIRKSGSQILFVPKAKIKHYFLRLSYGSFVIHEAFWFGRSYAFFSIRSICSLASYGDFGLRVFVILQRKKFVHLARLLRDGYRLFRNKYTQNVFYDCIFLFVCINYWVLYGIGILYGVFEYAWREKSRSKKECYRNRQSVISIEDRR